MENSERFFFKDDSPQWYIAAGERWIGPLTASDIYERILSNQITWAHFIWKKGQPAWKRICEVKDFQAAVPSQPAKGVQKEVKESTKPTIRQAGSRKIAAPAAPKNPVQEVKNWFLYYNNSQYGPFSQLEIQHFLKSSRIHPQTHGWKEGMKSWERLDRIPEFQIQGPKARQETFQTDQRSTPRRPLVAKILMADEQSVIVGVCRDISVGGLQVLTERIPANVGARLKMNISPSTNDSGKPIEPFVAEGTIVRILEDGRGFSFRFDKLTEKARQSIELYFES